MKRLNIGYALRQKLPITQLALVGWAQTASLTTDCAFTAWKVSGSQTRQSFQQCRRGILMHRVFWWARSVRICFARTNIFDGQIRRIIESGEGPRLSEWIQPSVKRNKIIVNNSLIFLSYLPIAAQNASLGPITIRLLADSLETFVDTFS